MKQVHLLLALLFVTAINLQAQRRYFDPIFDEVEVETSVEYGVNATVLFLAQAMQAVPQSLQMDVYQPANDTETNRPLVIIMHSGNFLPPTFNGGCVGTIKDADNVELATQLAKRGFVAAVADYRLGWNPVASTQTERIYTLINAAYRGVQDSRTCIRYFRKEHASDPNRFGIDPDKIVLWGFGTGGYISLASATLDTITDTFIPKFVTANGPMVIEQVNGNPNGTNVGVTFPGYPGFPAGDTLNYPNHLGFSSDFALAVNLGGALADTSFIDANDVPIISFHVESDPFAPCATGIVNVPQPPLPVVEVSGACDFNPIINDVGLQDDMVNANFTDGFTAIAKSRNGDNEGFWKFFGDNSSPWNFANVAEPYGVAGSDCDTDKASALVYMDTILKYFMPRACEVLGLSPDCQLSVGVNQLTTIEVGLNARPNPASEAITLQTDARYPMQTIELFDLTGRQYLNIRNVNTSLYTIQRDNIPSGVYFAKVGFKEGISTQRIILK